MRVMAAIYLMRVRTRVLLLLLCMVCTCTHMCTHVHTRLYVHRYLHMVECPDHSTIVPYVRLRRLVHVVVSHANFCYTAATLALVQCCSHRNVSSPSLPSGHAPRIMVHEYSNLSEPLLIWSLLNKSPRVPGNSGGAGWCRASACCARIGSIQPSLPSLPPIIMYYPPSFPLAQAHGIWHRRMVGKWHFGLDKISSNKWRP
jgi:hypothetical protein